EPGANACWRRRGVLWSAARRDWVKSNSRSAKTASVPSVVCVRISISSSPRRDSVRAFSAAASLGARKGRLTCGRSTATGGDGAAGERDLTPEAARSAAGGRVLAGRIWISWSARRDSVRGFSAAASLGARKGRLTCGRSTATGVDGAAAERDLTPEAARRAVLGSFFAGRTGSGGAGEGSGWDSAI